MADISPAELPSKSAPPEGPAARARVHSYSRITTAIAVLGLATAAYALWRLDATRDRLDQVNDLANTVAAQRNALQGELQVLSQRENQSTRELIARLDTLSALPGQVRDLNAVVDDLHGRAEGPQRAWSRAEALFLMEIAQRSLVLDRDIGTAIAALESADSRLASVRDPALTNVRQQLATELQALRATRVADRTGLMTRLAAAEAETARLPVKGLTAGEREPEPIDALPSGWFARARAILARALASLVRVRNVDEHGGAVVTQDEQLVRKQHLQLLLFTARSAVPRSDQPAYRTALSGARRWLGEFFDVNAPSAQALLKEIQLLEAIEIDPKLPDISKSGEALQRLMPQNAN